MATTVEKIKKGRKYDQVLEGARNVFMKDGFEGASVDDIAKAAGVSKATLYSYFPDKRHLFGEIARVECIRQSDNALEVIDRNCAPEVVLRNIAYWVVGFFTSEFGANVFRICVAESARFPKFGQDFYDSGPALGRERIGDYLREACQRGELKIDDIDLAADQFIELCKVTLFPRLVCGVQCEFSDQEKDRVITGAVEMFMARYGVHG